MILSVLHFFRDSTGGERFVADPSVIRQFAGRFRTKTALGGTPVRAALAMEKVGCSAFLYDRKFHFLSYKKDAPLRMRTRAKSRVLPDGNRARRECAPRRTLFYVRNALPGEASFWERKIPAGIRKTIIRIPAGIFKVLLCRYSDVSGAFSHSSRIPFSRAVSRTSAGQMEHWTSPIWALRKKNMQIRD